jgi:hypothetical protein
LSFSEPLDKVRKRIEELLEDVHRTRESIREIIKSSRPKPLKKFVEKKVESFRPLRVLRKRAEEES